MQLLAQLTAANPVYSLLIPVIVVVIGYLIYKLSVRFGLDKSNEGDEVLLTPEDFFMHGKDPHL